MRNPFELIDVRLSNIESLILDLKHGLHSNQQKESPQDELLNVKEAAQLLGITVPTLYSKKSRGEIPACKPIGSKRLYFSKMELLAFIKAGKQKTNAEIEAEANDYLNNKKGGSHA